MATTTSMSPSGSHVAIILLPLMAVVLIGFLIIGLALPVLPLHVHQDLGLSAFVVGIVAGSQFALVRPLRGYARTEARRRHRALVRPGGGVALSRLATFRRPACAVGHHPYHRSGGTRRAESFIITGALSWGLDLVDAKNA